MSLAYQAMKVAVSVAGPVLISVLLVGLIVSLFQAATQINEMTLSFIPKMLAALIVIVVGGPFFIATIVGFTQEILLNIPNTIG